MKESLLKSLVKSFFFFTTIFPASLVPPKPKEIPVLSFEDPDTFGREF